MELLKQIISLRMMYFPICRKPPKESLIKSQNMFKQKILKWHEGESENEDEDEEEQFSVQQLMEGEDDINNILLEV